MSYDIIIGRNKEDKETFGKRGTIYLGKQFVQMGQTVSLSNKVLLDINRPHVIMVSGKRGSGKSYSLSVMAEEMISMEEELKKNLSFLFFDTMGIFWTMRYPNTRQEELLEEWGLKPEKYDVNIFTPKGYFKEYKSKGISDRPFSLKTSELDAGDWMRVFELKSIDDEGILLSRILEDVKDYSIKDIIMKIKMDETSEQKTRNSLENRFVAAEKWGLFDEHGTEIRDLIKPGETSVIDISCYTGIEGVKALVIGLISRKLLNERIALRKYEELEEIERTVLDEEEGMPLVWILIDEAHNFLPKEGKTPASDALIHILREGRQPGISLVLATQQPGEIHKDVLTQSDIIISHRLTAKPDIEALNSMMQSYLVSDLQRYINELPRIRGSAIVLDDNSERIYPIRVHPKKSWHGGEAPKVIRQDKEETLVEETFKL